MNGIHEVAGSIPASSTKFQPSAGGKGLAIEAVFGFGSWSHAELTSFISPLSPCSPSLSKHPCSKSSQFTNNTPREFC